MLSGTFGKIRIAQTDLKEESNILCHRKSELLEKKYNKVTTGLERIKIIHKFPEFQNIQVDNDLLSITYESRLLDSQIRLEDLSQIIKKSISCIEEYKSTEVISDVIDQMNKPETNYFFEPEKIEQVNIRLAESRQLPNNHFGPVGVNSKPNCIEYVESQIIGDFDLDEVDGFTKEEEINQIFKEVQKLDGNISRDNVKFLVEAYNEKEPLLLVELFKSQN